MHRKKEISDSEKVTDPEGMEFDDDDNDDENGFFQG